MKKIAILCVLLGIVGGIFLVFSSQEQKILSPLSAFRTKQMPAPTKPIVQEKSSALFVPYWSLGTNLIAAPDFDTLLYFGVSATTNGIDTTEVGYKRLAQFHQVSSNYKRRFLVIRMIDSSVNSKVLDSSSSQEKIIADSIKIAKEEGFDGIVLDFEINALAFDSVIKNITKFYTVFAQKTTDANLAFDITLYGDAFYRARPYDVAAIGKQVGRIYLMTYDFHKARGNPGPNFPLSGKDTYGYDLKTMIADFSKQVPAEKLIVTFGLFGYDWTVDEKNQSSKIAAPLSFTDIQAKYLLQCSEKNCKTKRDKLSGETNITYTDAAGEKHAIWFEDPTSMAQKKQYLQSQGLNASSVWAYSYF